MRRATLGRIGVAALAGTMLVALVVFAVGVVQAPADAASPPVGSSEAPLPVIRREIRVRVACDEEFRAQRGWEGCARMRMVLASAAFEFESGIRWRLVDIVPWTSDDDAASLGALLDRLEDDVPRDGVDVVVGFTGQTRARGADRDYRYVGQAPYFGRAAIVRRQPGATEESHVGTLVHELGHVLGAWHCADRRFVMHAGGHVPRARFDPQMLAVLGVTRDVDFALGADWLDDALRRRLDDAFRGGHAPYVVSPYVDAEMRAAWSLTFEDSDVIAGRAAYRRALEEQGACAGAADSSIVTCLIDLARADLREPGRDVDEAERLALRAHDIAVATSGELDPPLDDELVLADVDWARGRRRAAVERYDRVHDARLAALGASDPDTVFVMSSLEHRIWSEAPADVSVRLRRVRLRPRSDGTPPSDWSAIAFDVSPSRSGVLALRWVDVDRSSGVARQVSRCVAAHVPAADGKAAQSAVGFASWSVGALTPRGEAACRGTLVVHAPESGPWSRMESYECGAPVGQQECVDDGVAVDDDVDVPSGDALLRRRRWRDASSPAGEPLREWRIEMRFVPDSDK